MDNKKQALTVANIAAGFIFFTLLSVLVLTAPYLAAVVSH